MCNCKNGTTVIDFLTLVPGGTAANANYVLNLTHYTCGHRKLCANGYMPVTANLNYQVLGTPNDLGNGTYCCDVLCTGQVTYMPYKCGDNRCKCNTCPVTDNIYVTMCVPCSSVEVPTITAGKAVAAPSDVKDCCPVTNAIGIATSFNVTTAAAVTTSTKSNTK
jgi:hypothetical protein